MRSKLICRSHARRLMMCLFGGIRTPPNSRSFLAWHVTICRFHLLLSMLSVSSAAVDFSFQAYATASQVKRAEPSCAWGAGVCMGLLRMIFGCEIARCWREGCEGQGQREDRCRGLNQCSGRVRSYTTYFYVLND
ncbi:hypothetical protein B0H10DRAFT_1884073 [Mycena sp. CBHHK59/15]|nr:hypothetical protein B0H10DRAFT_1884073 [Mycena sp. CBHHK59/15]